MAKDGKQLLYLKKQHMSRRNCRVRVLKLSGGVFKASEPGIPAGYRPGNCEGSVSIMQTHPDILVIRFDKL